MVLGRRDAGLSGPVIETELKQMKGVVLDGL